MTEVVCGVIENGTGRYLACRRPLDKHLGGRWEFPGGKIDPGESPEDALVRELMEELGVQVTVTAAMNPVIWDYDRGRIRLLPYRCEIIAGEPRAIEHEAILWCLPGEFEMLEWAEADLPVIREILENPTEF